MKEIDVKKFKYDNFNIGTNWALVTAGTKEKFNTMTISWGTFGELWNEPIVTIFIRHQRYTKKFID